MFQTEIVIFLQSFSTDFIIRFFTFFTEIGRFQYSIALAFVILFAVNFRIGFILIHAISWCGLLTMNLKEFFSLPRPINVDLNVQLLDESGLNPTHFESMGAKNFFGGLPEQVVAYFRAYPTGAWGFPSGHASQAMTLWGFLFMHFKKIWIRLAAVIMIVFIPLSRMYLGRHFLADIFGGLLLGLMMVIISYRLVYRSQRIQPILFERPRKAIFDLRSIVLFVYFLVIPFVILLILKASPQNVAALLGFNIGFLLIRSQRIPQDSGTILQRGARLLIAGAMLLAIYIGMDQGTGLFFSNRSIVVEFFRHALTWMLFFWGSVEVSVKLGLYKR
jgi:membrane-associated phospholipid phosphatase